VLAGSGTCSSRLHAGDGLLRRQAESMARSSAESLVVHSTSLLWQIAAARSQRLFRERSMPFTLAPRRDIGLGGVSRRSRTSRAKTTPEKLARSAIQSSRRG